MILLPPGGSSAAIWRPMVRALEGNVSTWAIHMSGFADTEAYAGEGPVTLDIETDAALAVLAHVPAPMHLVGHSYGGAVALRLILRKPELFASLTLIEPASYPFLDQAGEVRMARDIEAVNNRYIAGVRAGDPETAFSIYYDYYNGRPGGWAALPDEIKVKLVDVAGAVAQALEAVHASPTTLNDCAEIAVPALILHGGDTDPVHARIAELTADAIPGASLTVVEGTGHMVPQAYPELVAGLIADHIGF